MPRRVCPVCGGRALIASGESVCDWCMGLIPSRLYLRLNESKKMKIAAYNIWQENLAAVHKWLNENEL